MGLCCDQNIKDREFIMADLHHALSVPSVLRESQARKRVRTPTHGKKGREN